MGWIRYSKFEHEAHNRVLVDYVEGATTRLERLTKDIVDLTKTWSRVARIRRSPSKPSPAPSIARDERRAAHSDFFFFLEVLELESPSLWSQADCFVRSTVKLLQSFSQIDGSTPQILSRWSSNFVQE